jgi:hypothetical protein
MNAREGVRAVGAGAVTLFGYRVVKGWLVVVEAGHPIFFRLSFYFRATDERIFTKDSARQPSIRASILVFNLGARKRCCCVSLTCPLSDQIV